MTTSGEDPAPQNVKPRAKQSECHEDKNDECPPGCGFSFRRNCFFDHLNHRGIPGLIPPRGVILFQEQVEERLAVFEFMLRAQILRTCSGNVREIQSAGFRGAAALFQSG